MANKITVIFDDKMIYVDGVAIECNFSAHKVGLKAIQWNGASGQMEIEDPDFRTVKAVYSVDVEPYYNIWLTEKERIDAEIQAQIDYENSPEGIAEKTLENAKIARAEAVSRITVEVDGMVFDGDEKAQERMSRTVSIATANGMPMTTETTWVLADNTIAQVTLQQLAKACLLAGQKQTELWTVPYQNEETNAGNE